MELASLLLASDIKKNEQKLKEYASLLDNQGISQAKKIRLAKQDKLEEALYAWFIQKRSTGTAISF